MNYDEGQQPKLLFDKLNQHSSDSCEVSIKSKIIRFWRLDITRRLPTVKRRLLSKDLLREILDEVIGQSPSRQSITASINGKCGASNMDHIAGSVESIYGALKLRFEKPDTRFDENLMPIMEHPDFEDFLTLKAREMFAKWNLKRKQGS